MNQHICKQINKFPLDKFHQIGEGVGERLLIVGESPAPNGWIVSGKACYRADGKILPTGKRLNELLEQFGFSVETSGFTELSKCFVAKRSELESCSKKCWPIFLNQIEGKEYRLLIILGVLTTKILSKVIDRELIVGEIAEIDLHGKKHKVLPIFHPSPINPTGHAKNVAIFKKLKSEIGRILLANA